MGYWRAVHQKALAEALRDLRLDRGGFMTAVLVFSIYVLLVWTQISADEASLELKLKILSTLAPLMILPVAYLVRFFGSTRSLYEESERSRQEVQTALADARERRARIAIKILTSVSGGQMSGQPDIGIAVLIVEVRNEGPAPTSLANWRMWADFNGVSHNIPLDHLGKPLSLGGAGPEWVLQPHDEIYGKTHNPVAEGARVSGHLVSIYKRSAFPFEITGSQLNCSAEQIDGTVVTAERDLLPQPINEPIIILEWICPIETPRKVLKMDERAEERFDTLLKAMASGDAPTARKKSEAGSASSEAADGCSSGTQTCLKEINAAVHRSGAGRTGTGAGRGRI